jgi:hypothetical protein
MAIVARDGEAGAAAGTSSRPAVATRLMASRLFVSMAGLD